MCQESPYIRWTAFAWMAQIAETHKASHPIHIPLFGSDAVVLDSNNLPDLVEQARGASRILRTRLLEREQRGSHSSTALRQKDEFDLYCNYIQFRDAL